MTRRPRPTPLPRHKPPHGIGPGPGPTAQKYPRIRRSFSFGGRGFGFGRSASAQLAAARLAVVDQGNSLISRLSTGYPRGQWCIDLQLERTALTQVAGQNDYAIAIGNENEASATEAVAIGRAVTSAGARSVGIGSQANPGTADSVAIGTQAFVGFGAQANAIGYQASARIPKTTNISGPIIGALNNFQPNADWFQQCAGAAVILRTAWLDAKVVADYIITLPSGCRFWIDDLAVYVSSITGVTAQPFVHFGISGTPQKYQTNVQTVNLNVIGGREMYFPAPGMPGETSLLFGISTAATGAGMMVSAYWRGVLFEN